MSKIQNEYIEGCHRRQERWNKQRQHSSNHKLDKMLPRGGGVAPRRYSDDKRTTYAARHDHLPGRNCLRRQLTLLTFPWAICETVAPGAIPPPAPPDLGTLDQESGETAAQRQQRIEASLRQGQRRSGRLVQAKTNVSACVEEDVVKDEG
jgi:hypothetical protein